MKKHYDPIIDEKVVVNIDTPEGRKFYENMERDELTPLEALNDLFRMSCLEKENKGHRNECAYNDKKIIKTAFKRLVYLEERVDDLKKDKKELQAHNQMLLQYFKVLEIIKVKEVDIALFKECPNIDEYNNWCSDKSILTQEEYALLKKVLL